MNSLTRLNDRELRALSTQFRDASPFPHVVIDDFIDGHTAKLLRDAFPSLDDDRWTRFKDFHQRGKAFLDDIDLFPAELRDFAIEMASPRTITALEAVTGIAGLLPDPWLKGGGLHVSGPGGHLSPHTDFHIHPHTSLYRRLNALLYLNEAWDLEDGGCLELFADSAASSPSEVVVPRAGRLVLFATDDRSVHGFPKPIREGSPNRLSMAFYYYTAKEARHFSGDANTYWRTGGAGGSPKKRRIRGAAYSVVLRSSKALAVVAHKINPLLEDEAK